MNTFTVGLVQQQCSSDREYCLDQSIAAIKKAADQGAKLVLLQELHTGLYFCQTENHQHFNLAETIPGPTTQVLGELAKQLQIVIVSSLFEKRAPGVYHNTAAVLDRDGSIAGKYRKMHIPDDPGYYEKFYFTPGDLGFKPIATSIGNLGILICWDQWFPEAARIMALRGADILLYPTAIGWLKTDDGAEQKRQRDAWILVQRGHAIANGIPILVSNRVGFEENSEQTNAGITFWGSSFIAGQQGELLAEASTDKPEVLTAEIDLSRNEKVRRYWPYLRDRRIDAYTELMHRYCDT